MLCNLSFSTSAHTTWTHLALLTRMTWSSSSSLRWCVSPSRCFKPAALALACTCRSTPRDAACTHATTAVQKLLSLLLPVQCKFAIHQSYLQHRVTHLPRVACWSAVKGAMSATADTVADTALLIGSCQVPPGSDHDTCAHAQIELSVRYGGMGLHRLSPADPMHFPHRLRQSSFSPFMDQPAQASARSGPSSVPCRAHRPPRGGG